MSCVVALQSYDVSPGYDSPSKISHDVCLSDCCLLLSDRVIQQMSFEMSLLAKSAMLVLQGHLRKLLPGYDLPQLCCLVCYQR